MSLSFPTSPANGDTHTNGTRNFTWNGVTWNVSASDAPTNKNYVDSHEPALIGSTQPTVDANSNSIKEGDLWYNTSDGRLYVLYNDGSSTQWVDASPAVNDTDTHTFIGSAAPTLTTRPDSSALVNGDMYIDTSTSSIYYYDFATSTWEAISGSTVSSDTHTIWSSAAPTVNNDGLALVNGDLWSSDTMDIYGYHDLKVYHTSAWHDIGTADTHAFVDTGAPVLTARPDGSDLLNGDLYIDDATHTVYYYDLVGTAWVATAGGGSSSGATVQVGSTAPTTNADGTTPLNSGTQWYDAVSGRTYVWYNDGDSDQWVDSSPSFIDVEKTFVASLVVAADEDDARLKDVPLGGMYAVGTATSSSDVRVRLV